MANFGLSKSFKDYAGRFFGRTASVERLAKLNSQIEELTRQRDEVAEELRQSISFEQILPTKTHRKLHEQLLANERVHRLDTVEELTEKRIGDATANKRCFARVTHNGSEQLTAGIFTALVDLSDKAGALSYADIPGNIEEIKNAPVEKFNADGKTKLAAAMLYTISSAQDQPWDKGGRPLAKAVYEYLHAEAEDKGYKLIISTLSPLRDFMPWLAKQDGFTFALDDKKQTSDEMMGFMDDAQNRALLMQKVLTYLLEERDPVLNFHLGNGAYLGDIKFNPGNKQDPVMINYVYPQSSQALESNAAFYQESKIRLLAPHLLPQIGQSATLQRNAASISTEQILRTDAVKPSL